MNINDHRDDIAAALAKAGEPEKYRRTPPPERVAYYWQTLADALLASPALARLLAAARDEARAEAWDRGFNSCADMVQDDPSVEMRHLYDANPYRGGTR